MLRLTPLRETASFQEALKEDRSDMLLRVLQRKFARSPDAKRTLASALIQLDMDALEALFDR